MMKNRIAAFFTLTALMIPAMGQAQTTTTTTTTSTSNAAQAAAIQQQITAGIENGTLSQTQIEELQAQELQLQSGSLTGHSATSATQAPLNEAVARYGSPNVPTSPNNNSPIDRRTTTGPDPFTYNSLGPDAYQSQKYKDPAYTVPAYPTTDPQATGTTQLTTGQSAGTPYGAGYAQQPIPNGTGQGVYAPATGTGAASQQGVYVYTPPHSR
jgi:hypothetical protein